MRERPSLDAQLKVGSPQFVNGVTNWVAFVATFLSFLWPLEFSFLLAFLSFLLPSRIVLFLRSKKINMY